MGSLWYNELGLEEDEPSVIMAVDQCHFMDYFDDELASILGDDYLQNAFSLAKTDSSSSSTLINNQIIPTSGTTPVCTELPLTVDPPVKQRKLNSCSEKGAAISKKRALGSPVVLNFGAGVPADQSLQQVIVDSPPAPVINADDQEAEVFRNEGSEVVSGKPVVRKSRVRPPSQTYDHIIAERKRREQLSQRFVALSAIVPGLKKMDKTSVLGDAIKYMKRLQERVKILEEQASKQTVESVVLVKKSQIMVEDEGSSDEKSCSSDELPLPEIEARVCNKSFLVKIHCEKRRGVLVKILAEVERLNLSVASTSVTPFGNLALDITIIAEMEKEISLTAEDVVKALRFALQAAA